MLNPEATSRGALAASRFGLFPSLSASGASCSKFAARRAGFRPGSCVPRWVSFVLLIAVLGLLGCRREVDLSAFEELESGKPAVDLPYATPGAGDLLADPKGSDSAPAVRPALGPTPTRVPPESTAVIYTVSAGDTLLRIAALYGSTPEMLMRLNGLSDADQISVGQQLKVALDADVVGPATRLLPDSEVVYGPGYRDFDLAGVVAATPGFLHAYSEDVLGTTMSGSEIVQLVATQFSVGPRVLLALLEYRAGWLTNAAPSAQQQTYPLGYFSQAYRTGLYRQLSAAADALNTGFYGWWEDSLWLLQTGDGTYVQFSTDLTAASVRPGNDLIQLRGLVV